MLRWRSVSVSRARAAYYAPSEKLLGSGVLDRFDDKTEPKVLEEAEQVSY